MRIASLLVMLITATSFTLSGCKCSERAARKEAELNQRAAEICAMPVYARGIATMCAAEASRPGLLERIRGRHSNCQPSSGCECQTAIGSTIIEHSSDVATCSRCNQVGGCACDQFMDGISPTSPKTRDIFEPVSSTNNAAIPLPPSEQMLHDRQQGSWEASGKRKLSSVVEPEQVKKDPEPTFGIYERTSAPEFVALPHIANEEEVLETPLSVDEANEANELQQTLPPNNDFTPVTAPNFPELPGEPGALFELQNWPINSLPASSPGAKNSIETPPAILAESKNQLATTPVLDTSLQDPVNKRFAQIPDQVDEISNQVSEISKRVAEISDHVFANSQPVGEASENTIATTAKPAIEVSEPVAQEPDEPVILKARPNEKFFFTENRVVSKNVIQPPRKQQQVPIYNVSHHALKQMGLPHPTDDVRALPQMDVPEFSSPAVAKRAQTQAHLRFESDARRAQEQLFDIQAIIQNEIDKRIREGQLVPVNRQPPVQPETPFQTKTEQTADANRIPVLQVSQPRASIHGSISEDAISQPISLPPRRPAAPMQEFDASADEGVAVDEWAGEDNGHSSGIDTPNLFVPVLEIENLQPQLIEIDVHANPNENTNSTHDVQGPSSIDVGSTPIANGATIAESNPVNTTATQSPQLVPIVADSASALIRNENSDTQFDGVLRLRATANSAAPQSTPPIVRIRNVATEFRYQKPRFRDDEPTPPPSEYRQPPVYNNEPGIIEIETIRAQPIYDNEALQREIRGLTERPEDPETSAARIIDR